MHNYETINTRKVFNAKFEGNKQSLFFLKTKQRRKSLKNVKKVIENTLASKKRVYADDSIEMSFSTLISSFWCY